MHIIQEAEQSGLTAEDVQVALNHCGDANPVTWLKENWGNMMETVVTLASNVGHEAEENTIGTLSKPEAKEALRKHKGNIWAAVTECVEQRQLKVENTNSMKHSQLRHQRDYQVGYNDFLDSWLSTLDQYTPGLINTMVGC